MKLILFVLMLFGASSYGADNDGRGRYMGRGTYESDLRQRQRELDAALGNSDPYRGRGTYQSDLEREQKALEEALRGRNPEQDQADSWRIEQNAVRRAQENRRRDRDEDGSEGSR